MKQIRNPLFAVLFAVLPQAALVAVLALSYPPEYLWYLPGGAIAMCLLIGSASFLALHLLLKQTLPGTVGTCVLLGMLAALCALLPFNLGMLPELSNVNGETLSLVLLSVPVLYFAIALYAGRVDVPKKTFRAQFALCTLLPLACAMLLNYKWAGSPLTTILLNVAIALLCAAGLYFVLWMASFVPRRQHDTIEAAEKPHMSGFEKVANNTVVIVVCAMVMVPLGFLANWSMDNLLGDLTNPAFPILAVMNGVVMLPFWQKKHLSLPLLYFKIMGFSLIAYLVVIFIQYIPLAFIGIIIGVGLLFFAVYFVFALELRQIISNVRALDVKFSKWAVTLVIVAGAVTIPMLFVGGSYADRAVYQTAESYMNPGTQSGGTVNTTQLARILDNGEKTRYTWQRGWGWDGMYPYETPVFTRMYSDIVFDGKQMSEDSRLRMESIFFDIQDKTALSQAAAEEAPGSGTVEISDVSTRTEWDDVSGAYLTWVDMELKNTSYHDLQEYGTRFDLPDGCFVKDYYLYVGGEQKFGMLSDKRAALITYQSIVNRSMDPGIIFYEDENTLELRVFPFSGGETRKTGFCVMHTQPETLEIEGMSIPLEAPKTDAQPVDMGSAVFIPAAYKEKLPEGDRKAVCYFVIDASQNSPVAEHIRKVRDYAARHNISNAKVLFASYDITEVSLADLPQQLPEGNVDFNMLIGGKQIQAKGGYNLAGAMQLAQQQTAEAGKNFPIIIAVSDNVPTAVMPDTMHGYLYAPETEYYYNLGYDLMLFPYRLEDNLPEGRAVEKPVVRKTLVYKDCYMSAEPVSETVYRYTEAEDIALGTNAYENAFLLVQKSLMDAEDIGTVRDSFRQKVLTPATAFAVFETTEQEAQMLELQEQILSGSSMQPPDSLTWVSMDEGIDTLLIVIVTAGFVLLAWYKRRRMKTR